MMISITVLIVIVTSSSTALSFRAVVNRLSITEVAEMIRISCVTKPSINKLDMMQTTIRGKTASRLLTEKTVNCHFSFDTRASSNVYHFPNTLIVAMLYIIHAIKYCYFDNKFVASKTI